MIRFRRTPSCLPIGLDIGYDAVRMVQVQAAPSGLSIHAAACEPIVPSASGDVTQRLNCAAEAVGKILRRRIFRGSQCVIALPRELVHYRTLRLPPMPDDEIAWAVQADARDVFLFDTAKARIEYLDAGEVRQGGEARREIIMVAAGQEHVENLVERLHHAGARIASIDAEPLALHRVATSAVGISAVLEVGPARSQLIIGHGPQIRIVRTIEVGGCQFAEAISRKLGVDADEAARMRRALGSAESLVASREPVARAINDATRGLISALAKEVTSCLRYHAVVFRGMGPTSIRLLGSEAGDPHFCATLQNQVPIPLVQVSPWKSLVQASVAAPFAADDLQWGVALGLALRRLPAAELLKFHAANSASVVNAPVVQPIASPAEAGAAPEAVHA